MKVAVLGTGLVGGPIAIDLAKDNEFEVIAVDSNEQSLSKLKSINSIKTVQTDLSIAANVKSVIETCDSVINATPGYMGFATLKTIIESGKDVVDIAFFPENPFELETLAIQKNVVAIIDCGVAPGMSNVLVGYADHILDETSSAMIYVGGLPEVRELPWEYKAVFSPIDVIEEYTRPSRYIQDGKLVIRPALSEPELIDFPKVGTLEAFNTDGLRSLAETIKAPNLKEKTLRYPGHIQKIAVLKKTGFFSQQEIEMNGVYIRPLDFTIKILFPKWKQKDGDVDITVMRIIVEGMKDGKRQRYTYDLFDRYDETTQIHSMARTTGYTATVALRMINEGIYKRKGLSVPEYIGQQPECVEYLFKGLKKRGVIYKETITCLNEN